MNRAASLGFALAGMLALAGCGGGPGGGGSGPTGSVTSGASTFEGSTIGAALSTRDRQQALAAQTRALEYGRPGMPVDWHGRKSYGEVIPGASYDINDTTCRGFTHTITMDGQSQVSRGTACRQADGRWVPVG